jgi:hypothetical protein
MLRFAQLRPLLISGSVLLLLPACRDEAIASYRVPKAKDPAPAPLAATASPHASTAAVPPPAAPGAGMADTAVATATGAALTWIAPSAWQPKAASAMRKGSYTVGEGAATAELAITAFPGDVGGEVANVNRWRGQVGLAPLPDADTAAAVTRLEVNGLKIAVLDAGGAAGNATRLVGAMVPFGGSTWFFKLLGPDAVVAKEKPAFLAFLQTVRPAPTP